MLKTCHKFVKSLSKRNFTEVASTATSQQYRDLEYRYTTHNYHPIPAVLERGSGAHVWDVDGKKYIDFLAAYSAVNQGHCHPKIIETLIDQSQKLTLCSRAFHSNNLGSYAEFVCNYFGYDRVLTMNTGVEACESSIKIARRWGYERKGIPKNQARVIFANENFWGRSISAISSSTDPDSYSNYGPFTPGFTLIPYSDIESLEKELQDPNVCAFMCEPIQGEAGVVIPHDGYLKEVRELCTKYNVLWICDEVQTGCGRTGQMTCSEWEDVKPDMVTLGKAVSGGCYPVSLVLGSNDCMEVITPGTHGSTYGGNPLGMAVSRTALEVLKDEKMVENSRSQGAKMLAGLKDMETMFSFISTVRGRGLFCAIVIDPEFTHSAWDLCLKLKENGILAKPTHDHIIRLSPALCINDYEIAESLTILENTFGSLQ